MNTLQHKEQRIGIFVDAQNLYHSAKNLYHGRVNYQELLRHLGAGRKVIRMIAYVVRSEGIEEVGTTPAQPPRLRVHNPREGGETVSGEAAFFEKLEESGLELRMKDIQIYHGGTKKADWDVGMAVDAIRMAPSLDVVILVTGDGDFVPLVDYLKWGLGKQVEVAAFGRSASLKLKEACDYFINIENLPRIIIKR